MASSVLSIRKARPLDAQAIARIYVEAWRDTYPAVLPARLLLRMTVEGQAARWRSIIAGAARERVYVAEDDEGSVLGMCSLGRARDGALGFDGEIYTLYVDPMRRGDGAGRALLRGAFDALAETGHRSCVIWAHAKNPARFFYEAMGGRLVAERTTAMMGTPVPEVAFGWRKLALAEKANSESK
jgi:GNAT superfamily N-acetyltransferase